MKVYSITLEVSLDVEAINKREAVRIAKRAACPDLMRCSYIGDAFRSTADLGEEVKQARPPEKLSQGPSADDFGKLSPEDEEVPF